MVRPNLVPLRVLPNREQSAASDRATVEVYRPFFTAGIITVLTAGCLLGAIALFGISRAGTYTASAWTPHILAHANSQLFGWVGFFVIGFALQQHPPKVGKLLLFERLARASMVSLALGIALRFAAEPLVYSNRELGIGLGVVACILQIAGVVCFVTNTSLTRHRSGQPMGWQTVFVFVSLFWFLGVTLAELPIFLGSHQSSGSASIQFVAEWFPILRDAQFLGFVATMIFGVSQSKFSSCFGARVADRTLAFMGLASWTVGIFVRMFGHTWAYRQGFEGSSNLFHYVGGLCLTVGALYVVGASKVFGPMEGSLRSHKFIRAAFSWLIVVGVLVIAEPFHLRLTGQLFSHAYSGAIRHALTVGFISQMIVGVGSHVITRMNDLDEATLPSLWPTFWLMNVGNLGRVACEIGTDYNRTFFIPMGITGFLELVGLLLWAAPMLRAMYPKSLVVRNGS
ncbi:MAG: NnrS family protein [Fimbriimonadaceae bacterium]